MITGFLVIILLHNLAQQYPDSQPSYPAECQTLSDLGFDIIPFIPLNNLADIWIAVSLLTASLLFLFVFERSQLIFRRFFICYGTMFIFRAFTVMSTIYPRLPFQIEGFVANGGVLGSMWGSMLILMGVRTTARDMMFSGHTVGFIMSALFVSRYTRSSFFRVLYWIFNICGVLALIAVREHYSADVIVAIIITKYVFEAYHLWMDSEYIRFLKPGLELVSTKAIRLFPPLTLQDSQGNVERVEVAGETQYGLKTLTHATAEQDRLILAGTVTRKLPLKSGKTVLAINTWQYTTWARFRWYCFWHWLDAE